MSDSTEPTVELVESFNPQAIQDEIRANPLLIITVELDGEQWKITRKLRRARPGLGPGWERGKPAI